jgi:curved DNA-binding protein CbpA
MATARTAPGADPYALLGVARGASLPEVKRAFRRLAMDFHPDRAGSEGLERFLAVKAAYEAILDRTAFAEPGDHRPGSARPTRSTRPARTRPRAATRPASPPAGRSGWAGARWYWEGVRERASRRRPEERVVQRPFWADS